MLEGRLVPAGDFTVVPEVDVLTRLALFVAPEAGKPVTPANFVPVAANDARLSPAADTNVYVVTHGWAPGFAKMVQSYAEDHGGDLLKWWQTLDTTLRDAPKTPASLEMFAGASASGTVISSVGLAQAILASDPKAVILAYSWIDNAATKDAGGVVPANGYLSEAYTALNGQRLANALELALPADFHAEGGQLHVFGHSHGSKVATVATLALNETGNPNFHVAHLSVLDSPEVYAKYGSLGAFVKQFDVANNLWFYLAGLDIDRKTPGAATTFVDHYVSQVDNLLGAIQGYDPLDTSATTDALQNIVDVDLNGRLLYSVFTPLLHSYAFNWYNGGSEPPAKDPPVAIHWSPLLADGQLPTAASYTQTWQSASDPQFLLAPGPDDHTVSVVPTFKDLEFLTTTVTDGSSYDRTTGVLELNKTGTSDAGLTGFYIPNLKGMTGISFQYEFTDPGGGDQLVISVGLQEKVYYVMTGSVAGTTRGFGTLSLSSAGLLPRLRIELLSGSSGNATVIISNIQIFTIHYPTTTEVDGLAGTADASGVATTVIGTEFMATLGRGDNGTTRLAGFRSGGFPTVNAAGVAVYEAVRLSGTPGTIGVGAAQFQDPRSAGTTGGEAVGGYVFTDHNRNGEAELGELLPQATVILEVFRGGQWERVAETKTDAQGQFSFQGTPEGAYRFRLSDAAPNTVIKPGKPSGPATGTQPGAALDFEDPSAFAPHLAALALEEVPGPAGPREMPAALNSDSGEDNWLDRAAMLLLAGLTLAGSSMSNSVRKPGLR